MRMFFEESSNFANQNAQLFDFIHTSSAALWNLRCQVQGFVAASPESTREEIAGRFAVGSGIKADNLRQTCIETSWDSQIGQFAQIVSANLIAMFEGWAEELMSSFGNSNFSKPLQFPTKGTFGQPKEGIRDVLTSIKTLGISNEMKSAYHPLYSGQQKYSLAQIDALLAAYRYHKECRNSFMHRAGIANAKTVEAWQYASGLNRSDLGTRSNLLTTEAAEGQLIKSDIRESIQLSDILLRVVRTIDAELCYTNLAQERFIKGWKESEKARRIKELSSDPDRRSQRIAAICSKAGFAIPVDTEAVRQIGIQAGLLSPRLKTAMPKAGKHGN